MFVVADCVCLCVWLYGCLFCEPSVCSQVLYVYATCTMYLCMFVCVRHIVFSGVCDMVCVVVMLSVTLLCLSVMRLCVMVCVRFVWSLCCIVVSVLSIMSVCSDGVLCLCGLCLYVCYDMLSCPCLFVNCWLLAGTCAILSFVLCCVLFLVCGCVVLSCVHCPVGVLLF